MSECKCVRGETDGCTEWTCMYHGQENVRKTMESRAKCPKHKDDFAKAKKALADHDVDTLIEMTSDSRKARAVRAAEVASEYDV